MSKKKEIVTGLVVDVNIKKIEIDKPLLKKIKHAVDELNDVKAGKIEAHNFDDLLNEL